LLIIGDREVESNTLAVRSSNGKDLGSMTVADFVSILEQDISSRGRV
jgi:threonyl-tRNA synthetase